MASLLCEFEIDIPGQPEILGRDYRVFAECLNRGEAAIEAATKEAIILAEGRCRSWGAPFFRLERVGFAYMVEAAGKAME